MLYATGWKVEDSEEATIETADTDAASDELHDDEDVDDEYDDEEDVEDDEDDDDDEDIDEPVATMEEAARGNEAIISPAITLAEDMSGGIVSVVESTSGTTISSDCEDMIALDLEQSPSLEVEGRIVSSSTLRMALDATRKLLMSSAAISLPRSAVVLSHSVMHFEFNGSTTSWDEGSAITLLTSEEFIGGNTIG